MTSRCGSTRCGSTRCRWCGRDDPPRSFSKRAPVVCYNKPPTASVDTHLYDSLRHRALHGRKEFDLLLPSKTAHVWNMKLGDLCRITIIKGSQVGNLNFWNLHNPREKFYAGKTRQIHASHLTVYDRLWSCLPYLRPMATIVADSLRSYGIDEHGASMHDVIGTHCDKYTIKLITGKDNSVSCHSTFVKAVKQVGLKVEDIHDVWNIFMCSGFSQTTRQYFVKASPAQEGDFIEFIADMDLLVGLSVCPHGDMSIVVGQNVPDGFGGTLGVEVFRPQ